jgi:hypothetical protein
LTVDALDLALGQPHASLASTCETVEDFPQNACGVSDPRVVIDIATWQMWPARCRRNACTVCLPINARRRALAITATRPRRTVLFTRVAAEQDSDPLEVARTRMKRLRHELKAAGVPMGEWTWTVEHNPEESGYHAHAVQHGPYIPQRALAAACEAAGAGWPWIREIYAGPSRVARYGLKAFGAAGYGMKTFKSQESAEEALALNHGRLEHHTREFFVVNGQKMQPREAESVAIQEWFGSELGDYIVVSADAARYWTSVEGEQYRPRAVPL